MTTLLDKGIEAVRTLPPDRQDMAGELLLQLSETAPHYELAPEQIEDVRLALAEADRGDFADESATIAIRKKFGL